jgi:hypothetical protein
LAGIVKKTLLVPLPVTPPNPDEPAPPAPTVIVYVVPGVVDKDAL